MQFTKFGNFFFTNSIIRNKNLSSIVVSLEEKKSRGFRYFSSRLYMRLEDSSPGGSLFECEVSSMVGIFPRDFLSSRWKNEVVERVEDQKRGEKSRGQKILEKNPDIFGSRRINLILENPKIPRFLPSRMSLVVRGRSRKSFETSRLTTISSNFF